MEGRLDMAHIDNIHERFLNTLKRKDKDPGAVVELAAGIYERYHENLQEFWPERVECSFGQGYMVGALRIDGKMRKFDLVYQPDRRGEKHFLRIYKTDKEGNFREHCERSPIRGMHNICDFLGVPFSYIEGVCEILELLVETNYDPLGERQSAERQLIDENKKLEDEIFKKKELLQSLDWTCNWVASKLSSVRCLEQDVQAEIPVEKGGFYWNEEWEDFNGDKKTIQKFGKVPKTRPVTIEKAKEKYKGKSGVYFAWSIFDGSLQYVGKGKDVGERLHPKRKELKECHVSVKVMPEKQIHLWELYFIWLCQPQRNHEVKQSMSKRIREELESENFSEVERIKRRHPEEVAFLLD